METATHSKFFDDLDTFFTERGLRRRPDGEWWEDSYDYGVWWRDDDGRTYRLTWIGDVGREPGAGGELYLVRLDGPHVGRLTPDMLAVSAGEASGMVELLAVIPPRSKDDMTVERAAYYIDRGQPQGKSWRLARSDVENMSVFDREHGGWNDPARVVELVLEGWPEHCGPGGVAWLRERVAEAIEAKRAVAP